ncbi:MAG: hypothetical protein ABWY92_10975 [Xanthobacteraceae bacterium]|jgi:hypothetical protein
MMRSLSSVAVLAGLATTVAGLTAPLNAQEFRIEEASSVAGLAVEQLKPKTIAFIDRGGDELIDPDAGLIRFEDWAQARAVQKQFLSPYPSYVEPYVEITVDGVRKRVKEKLHLYVGQARFALARAPDSLNLASFVALPFVERMDPAIKHRLINSAEAISPKDPRTVHNQHPLRRWCEARPIAICVHSRYQLEGKLPLGIQIANKLRESPKKVADYLEFESEMTVRSPAEVAEMGLAALTGLDTPSVGALEQNIFYVNQMMQFGKLLAVFQRHPGDANRTVVTVFMALAIESAILTKKKEYANVPVLRNLVPAQVLAGKSSFNSGSSISAGLPVYARNQAKAIAALLERK